MPNSNAGSASSRRPSKRATAKGMIGSFAIAAAVVGAAVVALVRSGLIDTLAVNLFGPPKVLASEAYEPDPTGPSVDHSGLDILLKKHVNPDGQVDYASLKRDERELKAYLASLADAPIDKMGRDHRLALLINAYNAFTLQLILDHYNDGKLQSIKDIPDDQRWDAKRWNIGGKKWSLNEIEHDEIRRNFREPRIHWVLVCAAVGCPPLRAEAYTADRLEEQLEDQAKRVHTNPAFVRYNANRRLLFLTSLYHWYGDDFEQVHGSVLNAVAEHHDEVAEEVKVGRRPIIRWLDYDWTLNAAPAPRKSAATQPATRWTPAS